MGNSVTNSPAFANQIQPAESWQGPWLLSGTHANDINTFKYVCATHSCPVLYVHCPHTQKQPVHSLSHAKTRLLEQRPTEDSITPTSHVDKICRPIVKEKLVTLPECHMLLC